MSKVDWITWKTDPSEIIDPKKVDERIEELFQNYYNYMKPSVYDEIKKEITDGGLSDDAYLISNCSPLNNAAIGILDKINEIEETVDKLKSSISRVVLEQKETEKVQLINAIKDKIKSEEELKRHIESSENIQNNIALFGNNPEEIITIINDRIRRLNQKLIVVENL